MIQKQRISIVDLLIILIRFNNDTHPLYIKGI